ncbi:hypothetical protein B296_00052986 [Ensete ventricosum]|uniref:Uncharacterized protein n=1 Tax=Ensete ventricosum TaxID=4639 RepID=A0A426YA51_ENSVE|nr:hypothetical protein B296_00052986 [Ensete ventricosum]
MIGKEAASIVSTKEQGSAIASGEKHDSEDTPDAGASNNVKIVKDLTVGFLDLDLRVCSIYARAFLESIPHIAPPLPPSTQSMQTLSL